LAMSQEQVQVNVTFQRPNFNPYSPIYNLRWSYECFIERSKCFNV